MWLLRESAPAQRIEMGRSDLSLRCVWGIWTGPDTAAAISTNEKRGGEEKENMARRKLTEREMLNGVEKALASKKCPPQLKAGLQRRADKLRKQLGLESRPRRSRLMGIFRT